MSEALGLCLDECTFAVISAGGASTSCSAVPADNGLREDNAVYHQGLCDSKG